jgi:hypothetical protein
MTAAPFDTLKLSSSTLLFNFDKSLRIFYKSKVSIEMKRVACVLMLVAACGVAGTAHAETDYFESRPEKCREATARIVESTGGTFKAGKIDDIVEIGNDPPIIAKIDCGTSDELSP